MDRMDSASYVAVGDLAKLERSLCAGGGGGATIALVFGREASGLLSSEVLQCTHVCEIATSAVQGSMSLPSAATFTLGRAFEEALALEAADLAAEGCAESRPLGGDTTNTRAARRRPPSSSSFAGAGGATSATITSSTESHSAALATLDEVEVFMKRWEGLVDGDAGAEGGSSGWVRTSRGTRPASSQGRATIMLRRLLQRAQPTSRELRALHGSLSSLEQKR